MQPCVYIYLPTYLEIQDSKKRNIVFDPFMANKPILGSKVFSKRQYHDKNLGQNTHRSDCLRSQN